MNNNINHPSHYQKDGHKECIDEMREKFGDTAVYYFCRLNAYKYRYRAGLKDGNSAEQDLKKAEWYDEYAEKHLLPVIVKEALKTAIEFWGRGRE